MKWLYSLAFLFIFNASFGQSVSVDSSQVPYLQDKKLPFFKMMQTDSSLFFKSDLKKKRATVIVYFSPDCEHCQKFTELLTKRIAEFKKTQFVFVSPFPLSKVKEFYDNYHVKDYPGIKMGFDQLYFFGTYFHARFIPFIAAYDKKGTLIRGWEGEVTIDTLLETLK
ncbi:MAG: redoxin domain-containing protein [Sphingobacteriales bacterium]|nr:redoxin domain-containing protein [Sphingobacteriales bacterium]MBI3719145.1 redoxin domain-containing protein [Sphingobacteriales bacterium]